MNKLRPLAVAALLAFSGATMADTYPSRPITLVVGFPAGGGADTVARIVTDKMGKLLRQSIVIDNRPGAGTTISSDLVARAAPDGYTLLLGSGNLYGSDQLLYKSVKYEGAKSFVPISRWSSAPMLLAVNKDFSAKTVPELIVLARQSPGKLAYSSSGTGVITHLAGLSFEKAANVSMLHVPYKGGAPSLLAVASGDVQLTFGTPPSVLPLAQGGKLRVLAVTSGERSLPGHPQHRRGRRQGLRLHILVRPLRPRRPPRRDFPEAVRRQHRSPQRSGGQGPTRKVGQ